MGIMLYLMFGDTIQVMTPFETLNLLCLLGLIIAGIDIHIYQYGAIRSETDLDRLVRRPNPRPQTHRLGFPRHAFCDHRVPL